MGRRFLGWLLPGGGAWKARVAGAVLASVVVDGVGGCAAVALPSGVTFPDTPAGSQARWLVGAVAKALLSTSEIEGHFASALLAKVSPADLNSTLVALESLSVDSVASATSSMIDLVVTVHAKAQLRVDLCVDAEGFDQQPAIPAGWGGPDVGGADDPVHLGSRRDGFPLDRPDVHFLVASVSNGSCRAIISSGAEGATPLASSFKPIVLDARARAIKAGKVSWDEKLTITSATKSVRSGILQAEPDGTRIGAQDVASDMISISDNTAADMLAGKPPGGPVLLPATGRHRR